jgi:hypothetical protein
MSGRCDPERKLESDAQLRCLGSRKFSQQVYQVRLYNESSAAAAADKGHDADSNIWAAVATK